MGNKRSGVVLVVGGAGYVGSILVNELLDRGYAVRVLDRLYYGEQGLAPVRDRIELVVGDMRSIDPAVLEGVSAVINIGGLSNDPTAEYNPQANYEMNTVASIALAELCLKYGVRRYLFGSSCSVYDVGTTDEERDHLFSEETLVDPRAAYARSKFDAERALMAMAGKDFSPVILRKGTVYGFSPRMRYDLVVNTFVKDALSRGCITIHYGGEMWRPLVEVRDVATAYIDLLAAPEERIAGETFNLLYRNYRISELALRVQTAFAQIGMKIEILSDYQYKGVRSYRVSGKKFEHTFGFRPQIPVEESVKQMVEQVRRHGLTDFDNPRYYNIRWMQFLEQADEIIRVTNSLFNAPPRVSADSKIRELKSGS